MRQTPVSLQLLLVTKLRQTALVRNIGGLGRSSLDHGFSHFTYGALGSPG